MTGGSVLDSFMQQNNVTGVAFAGSTVIHACDAINAAAAMCYLGYLFDHDSDSGNQALVWALNAYEAGPGNPNLSTGGYGYSVLFKAHGNAYASQTSRDFIGGFMATGPSGTQYETGYGDVYNPIPTPGFSVSFAQHHVPWGSDSSTADRRICCLLLKTQHMPVA